MNFLWWTAVLLLIVASGVLFSAATSRRGSARVVERFEEVFKTEVSFARYGVSEMPHGDRLLRLLERLSGGEVQEFDRLLARAGWSGSNARFLFYLAAWLMPVGVAFGAVAYALASGRPAAEVPLAALFGFAIAFLLPRRLLRWRAGKRQEAMRKEITALLHLLRMLFDAGLSLEHTLQVAVEQGRDLIPNLAVEIGAALKRIQAGQERGDALAQMAAPLEVPELSDTVGMLRQVTRYGGNIRDSLAEYAELVEERQISELREYVSKLSAKMTVVMVAFLFPALLIFVAGPGFVGLARALGSGLGH